MESFESKKEYIKKRIAEIEEREPDDISDLTLTEYAFLHFETETDYDKTVEFLCNNPETDTIALTEFLIGLDEERRH